CGVRVKIDDGDDTIGKKIRTHRKMRPAYLMILGDGEMNNSCVSLRSRTGDQIADIPVDQFIDDLKKEIDNKIAEPSLVPKTPEN
ncbi:MAG: His/Gly/Thr/Pro-type tRNA ligase C-terminal domain-containing protein, partial [Candidatus Poseidoniaceae archaeon]